MLSEINQMKTNTTCSVSYVKAKTQNENKNRDSRGWEGWDGHRGHLDSQYQGQVSEKVSCSVAYQSGETTVLNGVYVS